MSRVTGFRESNVKETVGYTTFKIVDKKVENIFTLTTKIF